jgi:hypothetical protein
MKTDTAEPTEKQHEETLRVLRGEFATQAWPKIEREMGRPFAPREHQAAWLGFCAGHRFATST